MTQAKHTQFAMKALDMAEMFKIYVGAKALEGPTKYSVELGKPDGPSTGGGKQAMQPIKLMPQGDGTTLVAGHANQVERRAELRTYDFLAQSHAQRFPGADFPIERKAYDDLLARLEQFFKDQALQVEKIQAAAGGPAPRAAAAAEAPVSLPSSGMPKWLIAAIGVAVVAAAAVAAVFL